MNTNWHIVLSVKYIFLTGVIEMMSSENNPFEIFLFWSFWRWACHFCCTASRHFVPCTHKVKEPELDSVTCPSKQEAIFYPKMLEIFLTFIAILSSIWYIKSWFHPKDFPPGPRFPFPIIGDLYLVGSDFVKGLKKLKEKFGPTFGFWLGTQRCVVVTDFELLQDVLNRSETSSRQKLPSAGMVIC